MSRRFAHMLLALAVLLGPVPSTEMPPDSWTTTAQAKKKKKKKKKKRKKTSEPKENPAPAPTAEPAPPPAEPREPATVDDLLERARAAHLAMDFLDVIPLVDEVLARDGISDEQRVEAHALRGRTQAILGKLDEAEKDYRQLLSIRPDYEMPGNTAPKILAAFRKVQDEERAIAEQERERARARAIERIRATANVPGECEGGVPLVFDFQLEDPEKLVTTMKVHYRQQGSEPFSALALHLDPGGTWQGVLPAEMTANEDGLVIEYYLATAGTDGGRLVEVGSATEPLSVRVTPGLLPDTSPLWHSPWFWVAVGVVTAAAGVGTWLLIDQTSTPPDSTVNLHLGD